MKKIKVKNARDGSIKVQWTDTIKEYRNLHESTH